MMRDWLIYSTTYLILVTDSWFVALVLVRRFLFVLEHKLSTCEITPLCS